MNGCGVVWMAAPSSDREAEYSLLRRLVTTRERHYESHTCADLEMVRFLPAPAGWTIRRSHLQRAVNHTEYAPALSER